MKEIRKILELYDQRKAENVKMTLATVIKIEGSSFRRIGARMLIYEDGIWSGGISGGCLEGDIFKKAKKLMIDNSNTIISYDTRDGDPYQIGVGLGCKGKIDIYLESINKMGDNNTIEILRKLHNSKSTQCLAHIIDVDFDHPFYKAGRIISNPTEIKNHLIPEFIADFNLALITGDTCLKNYYTVSGKIQILFEIIPGKISLIVVGSNYDIQSIVQIGKMMEWEVHLMSNLSKLDKETINNCTGTFAIEKIDEIPDILITTRSALLLMSHDYKTDLLFLKHNIKKALPYIGVLGPRSRFDDLIGDLKKEGISLSKDDVLKIHGPIGLDIGADTPDSIALAICAEILAFFNRRNGGFLKYRSKKIYNEYQINSSTENR